MNYEKETSNDSTQNSSPIYEGVTVLVVDGDSACLTILSRMLCCLGYKVMTAQRASDALYIAHSKQDELHLVLTEVHLPDMDKYELLEKMGRVSKLPVVIMSDDDDESAMLGGLFKGAVFNLVKPLTMNSLKSLWQFTFIKKRDVVTDFTEEETTGYVESQLGSNSNDDLDSESVKKNEKQFRGSRKRKNQEGTDNDEEKDNADSTAKKRKMVWSIELHKRFLQAVTLLGVDNARPKKILQHMNAPELRKANVSSHLQKYRLSLKRDQEAIMAARSRNAKGSIFPPYHSSSAAHQPELRSQFHNSCYHRPRPSPADSVCFAGNHVDLGGQPALSNESTNHNQLPYTCHNYNHITDYGGQVGSFVGDGNNFSNVGDYGNSNSRDFPIDLDSPPIEQEDQHHQQLQPHVLFSPQLQIPSPPPLPYEQQENDIFGLEKQLEPQVMLSPEFKMPSPPPLPARAAQEKELDDIFGFEKQFEPHGLLSPEWQMPPMPPSPATDQIGGNDMFAIEDFDFGDFW